MKVEIKTAKGSIVVNGNDIVQLGLGNNSIHDVRADELIGSSNGSIWTAGGWSKIKSVVEYRAKRTAIGPKRTSRR